VRDDRERLTDVLHAVNRILEKTSAGRSAFDKDEMTQVWVLHHLQIIGEAARTLSENFRGRYPDKVWSMAAGMRHILVHQYFEIDADEVWKVVENDLPALQDKVIAILKTETS